MSCEWKIVIAVIITFVAVLLVRAAPDYFFPAGSNCPEGQFDRC